MASGDDEKTVVRVTLDRIYEQVIATKDLLAPIPAQVHDHETRIRSLETFKAKTEGARGFVTGVMYVGGGALVGFILNHVVR